MYNLFHLGWRVTLFENYYQYSAAALKGFISDQHNTFPASDHNLCSWHMSEIY